MLHTVAHRLRTCSPPLLAANLFLFVFLVCTGRATAQSFPIGWTPLPNTALRSVCPPNSTQYAFSSYCQNVVLAWSSGAVDASRNRLIIWGGGHGDYFGNEVYVLDLNTRTIQRLNNPSPLAGSVPYPTCPDALPDGSANSRHTYDGIAYMEHVDRLFAFGGSVACAPGNATRGTWTFDFETLSWRNMQPTGPIPRGSYGVVTAYDPVTRKVYLHDLYTIYAYSFETNSYERLSPDPGATVIDYHMTAAIDPKRRRFVIVGGPAGNGGGVTVYDLGPSSTFQPQKWTTSGGASVINVLSPGLAYDPIADRMVAWHGGNSVYSLNMDTKAWTSTTFSGGPGSATANGTFGRWDYVPNLGVFAVLTSVDANAYVVRLAEGSTSGDSTPPVVTLTGPASGATLSGAVTVSATASDNVAVAGVQFTLDGVNLGAEDTTNSYVVTWDTATATNGPHSLTAVARDAAGNVTSSATVTVTVSNAVTPTAPVAAYAFNENTGTTTADGSGNAHTGTLVNGAGWTASGKNGAALSCDGIDDRVDVNDAPLLDLAAGMTLEAWVNPTAGAVSGYRNVILKGGSLTPPRAAYDLDTNIPANVPASEAVVAGTGYVAQGSAPLPSGTWSHIATTYDGVTLRLYVGGIQVGTRAIAGSMAASTLPLQLCGNTIWSGQNFAGKVDDVRIYSRALTTAEIQADMATPVSSPGDTVKPAVSITAPIAGATLSSTVTVSATASDNVGVAGVQFKLDGLNLGAEDTSAPYTISWDTKLAPNGPHSLTAVARDSAGNVATSTGISVTVSNVIAGLVAGYAFDEGSGTTVADASGNGHTGTATGATWTTSGKFGKALSFNGTTSWVTVPDSSLLDLTTGMTLSAWIYPTANGAFRTVLMKEQPGGEIYDLYSSTGNGGPVVGIVRSGISGVATASAPAQPALNTWSHLAATYDGSTLRLFVNGAQVGTRAVSGAMLTSAGALRIGGNAIWGEYFSGRIDEVRVYSRALTAAQLQTDMTTPVGNGAPGDTVAPTVTLTAPSAGTTVSGNVTTSANASDNVGVSGVQFKLDGANLGAEDTTSPFSLSWDTRTAVNGTHVVTAVARDAAGNTTTSAGVTITVSNTASDTTKPTLSLTAPVAGTTVNGTVTVSATASDNVGVVGVQFKLDGVNLGAEDTTTPYSVAWDTRTAPNGSHTLTAVARDAAGNTATATGVTVTVTNSPSTGQITVPTGVFIALERPTAGFGPTNGTKHQTWAHNPVNGRLYQFGGDFSGTFGEQSYRQDMYSLAIAERWQNRTNRNAGWRQEYPFCGPTGGIQPKYPDYVGWTWDSRRNVFWTVPGQYDINSGSLCSGESAARADDAAFKYNHIMTFNPAQSDLTKRWTDVESSANLGSYVAETWQSVYDPVRDQIIRLGYNGGSGGAVAAIYDIQTRTWTGYQLGLNALGKDVRIWKEGKTADLVGRAIYAIDGYAGRLHRYNMDARTMSDLGPVPGGQIGGGSTFNDAYVAWDSVNRVLMFFRYDTRTLHIYRPTTSSWESPTIPVDWSNVPAPAPGGKPWVRHAMVFDPQQNVLLLLGNTDTSNPYMYIYRYASAPASPPASASAPDTSAPTIALATPSAGSTVSSSLTIAANASDNVGVVGVQFELDGANLGAEDTTSPYSIPWNTTASTTGPHTLSAVARDAAGNTTTSAGVTVTVSNPVADTTKPTVSLTAPSPGATVSGSLTVTASASDNIGVSGVLFKLDGVSLGAEDTTSPYSVAWSTTGDANGTHTLTAVARDAAGNTTTSADVTVTVANSGIVRTVSPSDPWCSIVNSARPGDEIAFVAGAYPTTCWITVAGTAGAPIVIRSQSQDPGTQATFTYAGTTSNVLEFRDGAAHLILRGFAFRPTQSGVDAIRIRAAHDLVIEANIFTGIGGVSVAANDADTQRLTVRGNTFSNLAETGLYFGCHDGLACHATELVIEDNVVDGVTSDGVGYGLEIKLNSWGTVRGNTIVRPQGPGIMVYGSNRSDPPSVVEQNYVEGSLTEGGIVVGGGPAIVRNNILVGNEFGGISAQNYGGRNLQQNVWIVHNTLLGNADSGINVAGWSAGSGNVIANNAMVPGAGTPALRPATPAGTLVGNVTCTTACFVQATTLPYDLTPAAGSPLISAAGTGSEPWRPADDYFGSPRAASADVGAVERP